MESNVQEAIFLFIIHNQRHFKNKCKDYIDQYNNLLTSEDSSMQNEIKQQLQDAIKHTIICDITAHMGISAEDATIGIEGLNVIEYIMK